MSEPTNIPLREAVSAAELFVRPKLRSVDLLALFWLAKWWMLAAALPVLLAGWLWASRLADRPIADVHVAVTDEGLPVAQPRLVAQGQRFLAYAREAWREGAGGNWPDGAFRVDVRRNRSDLVLVLDGRGIADPAGELEQLADTYLAGLAVPASDAAEGNEGTEGRGGVDPAPVPDAEAELAAALAARQAFQAQHGFASQEAEVDRLNAVLRAIDTALIDARALEAARLRQLAALDRRLADTPETLPAATGAAVTDTLAALERERLDLLTRYTAGSVPVQALDRQIAALKASAFDNETGAEPGDGGAGPANPVHAALLRDRDTLAGELDAARAARATLERERRDAAGNLLEVAALEPEWREIASRIDRLQMLQAGREPADGTRAEGPITLSRKGAVRLRDAAEPVRRNLRLGAIALAILAALLAGVLHARSRKTFATPASAARTLNRPVVAAIPRRR